MIDISAARDEIADQLGALGLADVQIQPRGADGPVQMPAIFVGMPRWTPRDPGGCTDTWRWPVAVVVDRPGTDDTVTIRRLDELWPVVAEALDQGPAQSVEGAEFGSFTVRGTEFPAQTITLATYR